MKLDVETTYTITLDEVEALWLLKYLQKDKSLARRKNSPPPKLSRIHRRFIESFPSSIMTLADADKGDDAS
jgi:hypothetical protein